MCACIPCQRERFVNRPRPIPCNYYRRKLAAASLWPALEYSDRPPCYRGTELAALKHKGYNMWDRVKFRYEMVYQQARRKVANDGSDAVIRKKRVPRWFTERQLAQLKDTAIRLRTLNRK